MKSINSKCSGLVFGLMALLAWGCGTGSAENASDIPPESSPSAAQLANLGSGVVNAWSAQTSEEYAPIACGAGALVSNMRCTGSNCDNVGAYCRAAGATFGDVAWTTYFSEEGTNYRYCATGYWMTGLVCRGSNCDDISIGCTRVTNHSAGTCRWADRSFSEEFPNQYDLPAGWYARGLTCTGSKCDNLRVYECQML